MGRYTGPVIRQHRRAGIDLGLKNRRGQGESYEKRATQPPGQHGKGRQKVSAYGLQLREKQKLKWIYGVLERQFRGLFERAAKQRGVTGEVLLQLLERRLDNVVYRILFAASRREARQMVNHGLIFVNDIRVDVASYTIKVGDKIGIRQKEATIKRVKASLEKWNDLQVPDWLELNRGTLEAKVLRVPTKADAAAPVEESQIVELYSK